MIQRISFVYVLSWFLVFSALGGETENWFIERLGMQNAVNLRYSEFYQQRGRWIGPDVLYVDFGKGNYREMFVGGGKVWVQTKRFGLTHEDYFGQTSGSASGNASYVLPWTKVDYRVSSRLSGNTVYFFYIPLNQSAYFHQSIERAKLEYEFKRFKLGAGYGGSKASDKTWQHKPMLTTTFKCGKFGNVEFWLQRLPGNHAQVQIRYSGFFKTGKQ